MPATTIKFTQEVAGAGTFTLKFETAQTIQVNNAQLVDLASLLVGLHGDLELVSLRFRLKPPGSQPSLYTYSFTGEDGREWNQEIDFDLAHDPRMDFATSKWRQSEFAPHRPIRDLIILLHQTHGLQDVKCDYEAA